ncbi:hypothetical protein K3495_g4166 [Podosphaera aphanis]|nr:hypothetical protein K3495_g4166 [Podosphaera aphanis]
MKIFPFLIDFFLRLLWINPVVAKTSISPQQANATYQAAAFYQTLSHEFFNDTENGFSGPCKSVSLIFAKGTGETGNIGAGSSPGPAWIQQMRYSLGEENIAVQGVNYSGTLSGYLKGGSRKGSIKFLDLTTEVTARCPDTKIILGGYSQGAMLAHNAALQFSDAIVARISAAVLFGDPFHKLALGKIPSSKVLNICHKKDIICKGKGGVAAHLNYENDASQAAAFALARISPKHR